MAEVLELRKQKIFLGDYDYKADIENRIHFSQLSLKDLEVLEEICCSSLRVSVQEIQTNLHLTHSELENALAKLEKIHLFERTQDILLVDKQKRKIIEFYLELFEEDSFGMEYLKTLLKKIPIHLLPIWYLLSKSVNNIFEGIVEKYLKKPHLYLRHIKSLQLDDPILQAIKEKLFQTSEYKLYFEDLKKEFNLSDEKLHEMLLLLEFYLVGILNYEKTTQGFVQVLTPYPELRKYLLFTRSIKLSSNIKPLREESFAFVRDMELILKESKKSKMEASSLRSSVELKPQSLQLLAKRLKLDLNDHVKAYFNLIATKLVLFELAKIADGQLLCENVDYFLKKNLEDRAIFCFRHLKNTFVTFEGPKEMLNEKNVKECEKSIVPVLDLGWVDFTSFTKILTIGLNEKPSIELTQVGRKLTYQYPSYMDEEIHLVKTTFFEHLFAAGLINCGDAKNPQCFIVTEFGRSVFGD
ncbi:MAG: hypothetical protein K940chlam8_01211 [Chlamydiae bacterium]|nr:hypothetical protein [Chlamydiota bacterium]